MIVRVHGKEIETTPEHPFYVDGKGWTDAQELEVGDLLISTDGQLTPVEDVRFTGETKPVYNLSITNDHTYFVGDVGWQFSVWVHNAHISPAMESKILSGVRKSPHGNKLIGGHSGAIINNKNPYYAVTQIRKSPNGTRDVKFYKQFADGSVSTLKRSTLFPKRWSDSKIMNAVRKVGNTPAYMTRIADRITFHNGVVDGVSIRVLKSLDNVTSAFPIR